MYRFLMSNKVDFHTDMCACTDTRTCPLCNPLRVQHVIFRHGICVARALIAENCTTSVMDLSV